jgi:hypothetical protein
MTAIRDRKSDIRRLVLPRAGTLAGLLLSSLSVFAQSPGHEFRTPNASSVDTLRLSIEAGVPIADLVFQNGLVGIGTTVPAEELDLVGHFRFGQVSAPGATADRLYNVAGDLTWAGSKLWSLANDGAGSGLDADTLDTLDSTAFAILAGQAGGQSLRGGTAAGENLTLDSTAHATKGTVLLNPSSGNVGVGTTAPAARLHVGGPATAMFNVTPALLVDTTVGIEGSNAKIMIGDDALANDPFFEWQTVSATPRFRLNYVDTGGGTIADILTALTGGNVGIRSSSPQSRLDLGGAVSVGTDTLRLPRKATTGNPSTGLVEGMVYYNEADNEFLGYAGTSWVSLSAPGAPSGTVTDSTLRWSGSAWVENTAVKASAAGTVTASTYTGTAGVTVSSGGAGALTLDSASGTLVVSDALQIAQGQQIVWSGSTGTNRLNFNKGGSEIFDDGDLRFRTDDNLYLENTTGGNLSGEIGLEADSVVVGGNNIRITYGGHLISNDAGNLQFDSANGRINLEDDVYMDGAGVDIYFPGSGTGNARFVHDWGIRFDSDLETDRINHHLSCDSHLFVGYAPPGNSVNLGGAADMGDVYVKENLGIGVGTSARPVGDLHLHGTAAAVTNIHLTNTDTGTTATDGVDLSLDGSEVFSIWHYENNAIRIATNNAERMRLDGSGRIGIGSTSPQSRLDLGGGVSVGTDTLMAPRKATTGDPTLGLVEGMVYYNEADNAFRGYDGTSWVGFGGASSAPIAAQYVVRLLNGTLTNERVLVGTANQVTVTDGAGTVTLSAPQNLHTAATPQFAGATLTGTLTFSGAATDLTTVSSQHLALMPNGTGSVGIGTTVPGALLHLYSTGDAILQFTNGDGNHARIQADNDTNGMEFRTAGTGSGNTRFFISESSNVFVAVGNAVTTPTGTEYLKVSGGTDEDVWINVAGSDGTTDDAIRVIFGVLGGANDIGFAGTSTGHPLSIRTNNMDRVTINTSGSMDIETPGATLRVPRKSTAGDPTGATGALYYNSNTNKLRVYEGAAWANLITLRSLNGLTGATQTFANDTNVTISSVTSTHTLGWSGTLAVSRGGTGTGALTAYGALVSNGAGTAATSVTGGSGQVLKHNGTTWIADTDAGGAGLWTDGTFLTDTTDNVGIGTTVPVNEASLRGWTVWGPGTLGAGGRVWFGDRTNAENPWVGESGTTDTDQVELSGKSGIVMAGERIPKWPGGAGSTFTYNSVTYTVEATYTWSENNHLYLRCYSATAGTWATHAAAANSIGGYLVTITSAGEQTAVYSSLGTGGSRCSIGCTDVQDEAGTNGEKFRWITGEIGADSTDSIYGNWASGEPNDAGGAEDIAEMNGSTGQWNDNSWTDTRNRFIVEISYMTPGQ